jgi:hypothetical protein
MDNLLKNWFRIFYILLSVIGIIVSLILLCTIPAGFAVTFSMISFLLAPLFFFLGTIAYNILKCFPKTENYYASFALLGMGFLVTLCFSFGADFIFAKRGVAEIFNDASNPFAAPPVSKFAALWLTHVFVTFAYFSQLIVFGLLPLFKGISKTIMSNPATRNPEYQKALPAGPEIKALPATFADEVPPAPTPKKSAKK